MANYTVKIEEVNSWYVEVEAEDENDASDKGYELWNSGELGYHSSDVSVIVED